jgi:hypothetical protein
VTEMLPGVHLVHDEQAAAQQRMSKMRVAYPECAKKGLVDSSNGDRRRQEALRLPNAGAQYDRPAHRPTIPRMAQAAAH